MLLLARTRNHVLRRLKLLDVIRRELRPVDRECDFVQFAAYHRHLPTCPTAAASPSCWQSSYYIDRVVAPVSCASKAPSRYSHSTSHHDDTLDWTLLDAMPSRLLQYVGAPVLDPIA